MADESTTARIISGLGSTPTPAPDPRAFREDVAKRVRDMILELPPDQAATLARALLPGVEIEITAAQLLTVIETLPIWQKANIAVAVEAATELLAKAVAFYADDGEELETTETSVTETLTRRIAAIYARKPARQRRVF